MIVTQFKFPDDYPRWKHKMIDATPDGTKCQRCDEIALIGAKWLVVEMPQAPLCERICFTFCAACADTVDPKIFDIK